MIHKMMSAVFTLFLAVYNSIFVCRLSFVEGKAAGIEDNSFWTLDFRKWQNDKVLMPPYRSDNWLHSIIDVSTIFEYGNFYGRHLFYFRFHGLRKQMQTRKFEAAFVLLKILVTAGRYTMLWHYVLQTVVFVFSGSNTLYKSKYGSEKSS